MKHTAYTIINRNVWNSHRSKRFLILAKFAVHGICRSYTLASAFSRGLGNACLHLTLKSEKALGLPARSLLQDIERSEIKLTKMSEYCGATAKPKLGPVWCLVRVSCISCF